MSRAPRSHGSKRSSRTMIKRSGHHRYVLPATGSDTLNQSNARIYYDLESQPQISLTRKGRLSITFRDIRTLLGLIDESHDFGIVNCHPDLALLLLAVDIHLHRNAELSASCPTHQPTSEPEIALNHWVELDVSIVKLRIVGLLVPGLNRFRDILLRDIDFATLCCIHTSEQQVEGVIAVFAAFEDGC
ncbi:hypothetical protein AC578_2967 [Pseudocercospora eumusae]|uniref:Uncharacterized protein n=1 Tax=Pseudocercospora eumusae TaxID=321146 RepID=A0A139HEG7_9PEZI|nr:hypothetical protein AC578_2967 [Pseudocercospora eumusae]